jgi:hypothetical protein
LPKPPEKPALQEEKKGVFRVQVKKEATPKTFPLLLKIKKAYKRALSFYSTLRTLPGRKYRQFLNRFNILRTFKFSKELNKKLTLILVLIIFLLFGFLIFRQGTEKQLEEIKTNLDEIRQKITLAEGFLIVKDEKKANSLFKEAWNEILPLTQKEASLKNEAVKLKEEVEKNLYTLNKLEQVVEPKLLFESDPKKLIPQKILLFGKELYLFSQDSENLLKINEKGEESLIPVEQKFNLATTTQNNILFFIKPGLVVPLEEEPFSLAIPSPDSDFIDFSFFAGNLYFLDRKSGEIIKYLLGESSEGKPYFDPQTKKIVDGESMAIDGSIWILNEDNEIPRYFAGIYQETLKLDIFPYPRNFEKVLTNKNLLYVYILEPEQNRVVVLSKSGDIIKQLQSGRFDNLKDFAVSEDGRTIYILNGQKIYQVSF